MYNNKALRSYALVAQLDRVTGYEPVGQGFESLPARQRKAIIAKAVVAFLFSVDSNGTRTLMRVSTVKKTFRGNVFRREVRSGYAARMQDFAKQKLCPFQRAKEKQS